MTIRELRDRAGREKKRRETAKAIKAIAVGVGIVTLSAAAGVATGVLIAPKSGKETRKDMKNKVLSFNKAVQRKTNKFKASASKSAQVVGNAIKDAHEKAVDVQKDIKDGLHDIAQEVRNTPGHIVNKFNNL